MGETAKALWMRLSFACFFASPSGMRSGCKQPERAFAITAVFTLSLASRELIIGFADFPEGEP